MSMSECKLTHTRLTELLDYCPDSGIFTHRTARGGVPVGSSAGTPLPEGYIRIRIDGSGYLAHRLAWFHVHGVMPLNDIDHINRNPQDNRLVNLREVVPLINQRNRTHGRNNTSGITGVQYITSRPNRPFRAHVKLPDREWTKSFKHLENAIIWRELRLIELGSYTQDHGVTDDDYGQLVLQIRNEVAADPERMREKMIASEQQ